MVTSVGNYHYSLRTNPEERSSQLLRGGARNLSKLVSPRPPSHTLTFLSRRHTALRVKTLLPLCCIGLIQAICELKCPITSNFRRIFFFTFRRNEKVGVP